MKDLIELEKELSTNFLNNKIDIEFEGDITYRIKIENVKFLLNKVYLILSDSREKQLSICLDEVGKIEVEDGIIMIYFNYEEKIRMYIE